MITNAAHEALERALKTESPVLSLRASLVALLSRGASRDSLLRDLEAIRGELRATKRERDEDVVLDVMDFLEGWSSPHLSLRK
jgi:hypothetical protein